MDIWILPTLFCHNYKTHGYEILFYNMLILYVSNFGILDEFMLKKLNFH
jgi:hypothetical protein